MRSWAAVLYTLPPYVRSCLTVTVAGVGVIKKAMDPLIYKSKYKANNTSKIKKFPQYKNFKNLTYIKTNFIFTK